jgi:hypothetical protein
MGATDDMILVEDNDEDRIVVLTPWRTLSHRCGTIRRWCVDHEIGLEPTAEPNEYSFIFPTDDHRTFFTERWIKGRAYADMIVEGARGIAAAMTDEFKKKNEVAQADREYMEKTYSVLDRLHMLKQNATISLRALEMIQDELTKLRLRLGPEPQ